MTRSTDRQSRHGQANPGRGTGQSRDEAVSKAMSLLLRHRAEQERIPMTPEGYVNVQDLLKWHKMKSMGVSLDELAHAVEGNNKQRFALLYLPSMQAEEAGEEEEEKKKEKKEEIEGETEESPPPSSTDVPQAEAEAQQSPTPTQLALSKMASDPNPVHYLIRATQGHSIKTVQSHGLLTPLSLAQPEDLPTTVVHGTFYACWQAILASGGLKPMGRNHVHFAMGPSMESVLALSGVTETGKRAAKGGSQGEGEGEDGDEGTAALPPPVVISGMRASAQILIYIDLRKALAAGVPFWRSENGVLLTEGIVVGDRFHQQQRAEGQNAEEAGEGTPTAMAATATTAGPEEDEGGSSTTMTTTTTTTTPTPTPTTGKMLPSEFWDVVVETKAGLGVLWKAGEGKIKDLPRNLAAKGFPRGKGPVPHRGGRGGGKGGEAGDGGRRGERKESREGSAVESGSADASVEWPLGDTEGRKKRGGNNRGKGNKPSLRVEKDDIETPAE